MLAVLFNVFVYLLALYGAVYLVIGFVDSIRKRVNIKDQGVKFILLVKNQEDCVEGLIGNIFKGNLLGDVISEGNFTVLDMGSTDDTLIILEKLKRDYQYLNILKLDERDEIFKYFEEVY